MTARKLHFATATVQNPDDAKHGATESVLCEQQPRQGATLWGTIVTEDVDCAKCQKRLAEREAAEDAAAEPEIEQPEIAPVVEIKTKRERKAKAKTVVGTELTESKTQKEQIRAFNSGANYAANAARYGDAEHALNRYTKRRERQGNPAAKHELVAFAEGYAEAAAKLAAK